MNSTSTPQTPSNNPAATHAAPTGTDRLFARFPSFALALAMTFVGTNVGIGKTMVAVMPVAAFALWRFVIAIIALAPRYRPSAMRRVTRSQWGHLFVQTFFGTFLFTLLMLYGVRMTTATAAGVITATLPACVALLSWAVLREHPSRRTLVSIGLAIAGVALLNASRGDAHGASGADASSGAWLGNALVLGAVVCEAIYVIVSKRLAAELPAIDICAYTHLIGGLLMLPLGIVGLMAVDYSALTPGHWALIVWYGLAASVFSFFLWMRGIRHVSAQLAGVFTAMVPVAATAYGVIFLGERLSVAQGGALALTVAGIVLAALPSAGSRKTLLPARD
ncbi:EamA family transporter [Pandoraea sputorum]|uniref:Threonine and homoserine efflux system n=2 Tax=Pandoraea sputorum TaxID=93222 RepID=A0A239SAY8_9BURK|nr:threonine and homoserine efflux system [Pandoraea sputorum]VVE47479.1 EamA family transporter [Pandoraea sputorum]